MEPLVVFLKVQVVVLVVALYAAAIFQIAKGKSGIRGLFVSHHGKSKVAGVPLLGVTVLSSLYLIVGILENPSQFPTIPPEFFYFIGGSNLLNLAGKIVSR